MKTIISHTSFFPLTASIVWIGLTILLEVKTGSSYPDPAAAACGLGFLLMALLVYPVKK